MITGKPTTTGESIEEIHVFLLGSLSKSKMIVKDMTSW